MFFIQSTNGGAVWTNRVRVSTDSTTNDQWMPVVAVKPDGTQLFMSWYDRRNDTNNSLMEFYGRFATIATNRSVSFGTEFIISTMNFPPVFAGTLTSNTNQGHYDPVYPPGGVNLHWWCLEWPDDPDSLTDNPWRGHVGEYNGAWADGSYAYVGIGGYGASPLFYAQGSSPFDVLGVPARLIGLQSFSLLPVVPEPSTWALLALGGTGLCWALWRQRQKLRMNKTPR